MVHLTPRTVWSAGDAAMAQSSAAAQADAGGDAEPRDPQLDAYDKQRAIALEQGDFASWTALVGIAERLVRPGSPLCTSAPPSPPGREPLRECAPHLVRLLPGCM